MKIHTYIGVLFAWVIILFAFNFSYEIRIARRMAIKHANNNYGEFKEIIANLENIDEEDEVR